MNDLPFELFVAVRYLLARRKQAFISLISLISTLGVMVGVMALLIALALMTGLQGELRDRIVGSSAHVYVFKPAAASTRLPGRIAKLKAGAARDRRGAGRQRPGHDHAARTANGFVTIKGIVPELEPEVTEIGRAMQTGSLDALDRRGAAARHRHRQGAGAAKLGAFVGDTVAAA